MNLCPNNCKNEPNFAQLSIYVTKTYISKKYDLVEKLAYYVILKSMFFVFNDI